MQAPAKTCLICGAALSYHQSQTTKLCDNVQCRWTYSTLRRDQLCAVCGRPLHQWQRADNVCSSLECQRSELTIRLREQCEQDRLKREALRRQALALRDQGLKALGVTEPAAFPLVLIPSFEAPLSNLSECRRNTLRDHLSVLIGEATEPPSGDEPQVQPKPVRELPAALQTVLGTACARCRGNCCSAGGDQAYLTVATIRRFLKAHPEQRRDDVLAAYLMRVGSTTYTESCIYHGPAGCTLPRELRSDVCNRHFCTGLKEFQQNLPDSGPPRGFFVSSHDGFIRTAGFIDENAVLDVALPATMNEGGGTAMASPECEANGPVPTRTGS